MAQEPSLRHRWAGAEFPRSVTSQAWRFCTFEAALHPRWRGWVFSLVVVFAVLLLGGEALRLALVSILGGAFQERTLRRAVALDPANPELHHRLGMVLFSSLAEAGRAEGISHLRLATELNPHVARYWSDLASACEMAGDTACATRGFERAVQLSPMTPQVHWVAANSLLRMGQTDAAIGEFRRLLELDPQYAPATFHVCVGSIGDPQIILRRVLPSERDPELKLAYLSLLSANGLMDLAHQVWAEIIEAGTPFPFPSAAPYIEHLLALGRVEDAQGVWRDLEKLGVIGKPGAEEEDNLVFNGGFEQTPLDAGFDWRYQAGAFIALDFSDEGAHTGRRCLRIDFTARQNEEFVPLYQLVPVVPSRAYRVTAYVRSQNITSDSGPRLQVHDKVNPESSNAVSETTVGTTSWHPISLEFCTGPNTSLVQLSVIRVRSRTFPTEITGSFWLDTVVLKALGPASKDACGTSGG